MEVCINVGPQQETRGADRHRQGCDFDRGRGPGSAHHPGHRGASRCAYRPRGTEGQVRRADHCLVPAPAGRRVTRPPSPLTARIGSHTRPPAHQTRLVITLQRGNTVNTHLARALLFLATGALLHAGAGRARAQGFPDKNLEAAVKEALKETKALTDESLSRLNILEASGKGIKDLTGLEKCKNLAELKLTKNQIVDLKPLKDLTELQSLHLADNKITDLAPLAGLVKLQYLDLTNNQVVKLDPLAKLTKLST